MTTLTRTECEALLERLSDKSVMENSRVPLTKSQKRVLDFYENTVSSTSISPTYQEMGDKLGTTPSCVHKHMQIMARKGWIKMSSKANGEKVEILGHEVLIGDVLERITKFEGSLDAELLGCWRPLGFKTSLQSILNLIEWAEDVAYWMATEGPEMLSQRSERVQVAKPSPATNLFLFLKQINL